MKYKVILKDGQKWLQAVNPYKVKFEIGMIDVFNEDYYKFREQNPLRLTDLPVGSELEGELLEVTLCNSIWGYLEKVDGMVCNPEDEITIYRVKQVEEKQTVSEVESVEKIPDSTTLIEMCRASCQAWKDELKRNGESLGVVNEYSFNSGFMQGYFERKATQPNPDMISREKWISVNDRLPDHEKKIRVIRTFGNGRMEEVHTMYVKRIECFDDFMMDIITHWQEITLPEPPINLY